MWRPAVLMSCAEWLAVILSLSLSVSFAGHKCLSAGRARARRPTKSTIGEKLEALEMANRFLLVLRGGCNRVGTTFDPNEFGKLDRVLACALGLVFRVDR